VTRALISKELREHGWVFLLALLVGALMLALLLFQARNEGSPFVAFARFVAVYGPLLTLALINRLVVREYGGRTQLFLETLPLTRARVLAVKWLFGAALLLAATGTALAVTAAVASSTVRVTPLFLLLLTGRSVSFLIWFYALAFFIGLLGRYRYVAWGALLIGAFVFDFYLQLPLNHVPPLQLVSETMAFQRSSAPVANLLWTWPMSLMLVAGSFLIALWGEGSLGAYLAQRMSPREKVVIGVLAILPLGFILILDRRRSKPEFHLANAILSEKRGVTVGIGRAARLDEPYAETLADLIALDLVELREYLGLETIPPVFVLPDASLDGDLHQRATLPASDGVVVRSAIGSPEFEREAFRAFVVHEVLDWYTRGRASRENRRWLLDGFAEWWISRKDAAFEERLNRRAAAASRELRLDESLLREWLSSRESLGDCLGNALAWRVVVALTELAGADPGQRFLRDEWGRRPPDDARVLLEQPLEQRLQTIAGVSISDLVRHVAGVPGDGEEARATNVQALLASFEAQRTHGRVFEIHYGLAGRNREQQEFAVLYKTLEPWKAELSRDDLRRVDTMEDGVLPLTVEDGTRIFTAVEVWQDSLSCTVRKGARRWVVR